MWFMVAESSSPELLPALETAWLIWAGFAVVVIALAIGLWLTFGRGPRRRRAYQRALRLIHQKSWPTALHAVRELQNLGPLSPLWQGRARNAEGQCQNLAGNLALEHGHYEEALTHHLAAARLLDLDENEARDRIIEEMLAEVRRRFAASAGPDTQAIHQLIDRVLSVQAPCAEASFWQGLCHVRDGRTDLAVASLRESLRREPNASAASGKPPGMSAVSIPIDPPLYLGVLLLRQEQVQEALRCLSEANRIDPDCPFVTWQLGMAIVAAGGDRLAVRALQRALGPGGLERWIKDPQRAWVEAFAGSTRSFARRLAAQHRFICPVLGAAIAAMIRQGQMALAQAYVRLQHFQDAIHVYHTILQESPPSAPVLRGLGLALVKLGRYDEAFKQLRIAHEQEQPRNHLTAGYLALCGVRGKPLRPEDKVNNIRWAIQLLAQFEVQGDAEWAQLNSAVFAEARAAGLSLAAADQARLCDVLASVAATDTAAADAYAQLAATHPQALRVEHAWLYCWAVHQQGAGAEQDLVLFQRAFQDESAARAFYAQHQWDFDEVEANYLERCAAWRPGSFPEALGPDSHDRGTEFLLSRSRRLEAEGHLDAALPVALTLARLAPRSPQALARLAYLVYRQGDLDQAAVLLARWQEVEPTNHVPLVRQAIIERQRHNAAGCTAAIDRALEQTQGRLRAAIAFLGGRLALAVAPEESTPSAASEHAAGSDRARTDAEAVTVPMALPLPPPFTLSSAPADWDRARRLFQECLKDEPGNVEALEYLAAVRWLLGDREGLAGQSVDMDRPEVARASFHYLAAVCQFMAAQFGKAIETCRRAAADASLALESAYLSGLAHLHMHDVQAATQAFQQVASAAGSPSAAHCRALLGKIHFAAGDHESAIRYWSELSAQQRAEWHLDDSLRRTVFLSAVSSFRAGRFVPAVNAFREAEQYGMSCGPLLTLAQIRAAQQLLSEDQDQGEPRVRYAAAVQLLQTALKSGGQTGPVAYLLALAYKRLGQWGDARAALVKIARPDANVYLQLGWLSLRENQLAQAEQDFTRSWQADPDCHAAGYNLLLTRLSLGRLEAALVLLPQVLDQATAPGERNLLLLLHALLRSAQPQNGETSLDPALLQMQEADAQSLVRLVRGLGHFETADMLLKVLAATRPDSSQVHEACLEALLIKSKRLLDRCQWAEAERLLKARLDERAPPEVQLIHLNLLGCCACLIQDFEQGIEDFAAAIRLAPQDARLHQNLALAYEFQGLAAQADAEWERYLHLLNHRLPGPPGQPHYHERLAYACLNRLATRYSDKEQWAKALAYLQRAHDFRSDDVDLLERLFHAYQHTQRPEEAQRVLKRLQRLRPDEPLFELYDFDLIEVRRIDDVERVLDRLEQVCRKYPQDYRVEDRTASVIGHLAVALDRLNQHLLNQLERTRGRLRRLPDDDIDWREVRDFARDLYARFHKLHRATEKCLSLVNKDKQGRALRELTRELERQMEKCRTLAHRG